MGESDQSLLSTSCLCVQGLPWGRRKLHWAISPFLWLCLPLCPSSVTPFCDCVAPSPCGPMCLCVSWPHVSLCVSMALGGSLQGGYPAFPSCCPPVLFISFCCCDHSHAPHSVRGQGTLPGPCAVSHTAVQAPTCHPHEVFAVNKRFEDYRTLCCASGYGMDMNLRQGPFVPFTNAPDTPGPGFL